MFRVRAIVHLLMILACLLPGSSVRQASAAFVTGGPLPTTPAVPLEEEDDSERENEVDGKDKARSPNRIENLPKRSSVSHCLTPNQTSQPTQSHSRSPAPLDPFRNGLGSPYRC